MSIIWDEKSSAQGKRQTRVSGCEAQASEGKLDSSSIVDEEAALEGNLLDTKESRIDNGPSFRGSRARKPTAPA